MPLPRSTAGSTSPRPRATWQRAAVHDILERTDGFRSAQQIHSALEAEGTRVGLATVYRNCKRPEHHHHIVCRRCGYAVEIAGGELEAWVAGVSAAHGFTGVEHTAEFFGLCASCSASAGGGAGS